MNRLVHGLKNTHFKKCIIWYNCILNFLQVYKKELKIMGVNINPYSFEKGLALVQTMADTYLCYEKLGIQVFKLAEYRDALAALKRGDISKAVFALE